MNTVKTVNEALELFLDDPEEYVSGVAVIIKGIEDDYLAAKIDKDMRTELLTDAIELAESRHYADMLDTKIKIEKLIDLVKIAAKLL